MIYDDNVTKEEVPHYHTDETHKILGAILALDENNKSQVARMQQITLKFGDQVQMRYIRGQNVFHALNSMIMQHLNWPLPAITLTKQECTYIMVPIIKNALAKLKI